METPFQNGAVLYNLKLYSGRFLFKILFSYCSFPPTYAKCAKLRLSECCVAFSATAKAAVIMKHVVYNELSVLKKRSYYLGLQLAQISIHLNGFYFDSNASI